MQPDWEKLKSEYIHSQTLSLRSLAEKYKISYQSVRQHSAQNAWGKQKKEALAARVQSQSNPETAQQLMQLEKINRIAGKLLNNIEQGTELFEKPTHIATLTGALKEVTAILRDVNEIPNQKQRRDYELSKCKLEMERSKLSAGRESNDGGVVVLPEVKF